MNNRKRYDIPPSGWRPAESFPGHVVHWDGPSVVVGPGLIVVSTFRRNDGITLENMVDFTTFTLDELLDLANRVRETDEGTGDALFDMYDKVLHAEQEINR